MLKEIIPALFILLFIVMGVFLLMGKGAWMIAGYNTMPKREKEKWDEKALCRFMGKSMFYFAFCMVLMVADKYFSGYHLTAYGSFMIFAGVIFMVIYANTGGRFKKKDQ